MPIRPDPFLPNRLTGPGPEFGPVPDQFQNLGPLQSDGPTVFLLYKSYSLAVGDILPFVPHIATGRSHMNQNIFFQPLMFA